jgi:Family of unknown function (DUF5519)
VNERLLAALRALPDVEESPSQFHGEPAFWIDGREFVHTHGGDEIEVRLTGKLITRLEDERVVRRARTSDWVVLRQSDEELVLELARQALEANRRVRQVPPD